jgi:insulysin
LQNFQANQPYSHAAYFMTLLLIEKGWTKEDLLNSLNDFSIDDIKEFIPRFLTDGIYIDSMAFGNISKEVRLENSYSK